MLFPFLWECFSFALYFFYLISFVIPFSVGVFLFLFLFCLIHFISFFLFSILSLFILFNLGGSFVLVQVKQVMGFYRYLL